MKDPVSVINVPYCTTDIAAADLDHSAWNDAARASIAHYWSGEPAPAERRAVADLLWSDSALHIRFTCPQFETLIVSPEPDLSRKTLGLWDRDVCEAFIAVDPGNPERYVEFEVAPTGEWLDIGVHQLPDRRDSNFEIVTNMTVAATIEGQTVRSAMRLPWSGLGKRPEPGEEWRANLFRCVGDGPDRGYLAWRPTFTPAPNFHVPEAFGRLVFLGRSGSQGSG